MRRKITLFIIPLIFITIIFLVFVLILNNDNGKGALQVTSIPRSTVYLDGKLIGQTPICLCDLPKFLESKKYSLRLVPDDASLMPFEEKNFGRSQRQIG